MNELNFLRLRFINWLENLSSDELEKLVKDSQNCGELDRCFRYCVDVDCEYYALLLLVRTPTDDFRSRVVEWINSIGEVQLRDLLEKGVICGEQSFCLKYCGSLDCLFRKLINDLCAISQFQV